MHALEKQIRFYNEKAIKAISMRGSQRADYGDKVNDASKIA